ncbi:GTP-binding protein [Candidatus Woesearchaeota archaeon]|nr:GTP-binding protein [Candidatus Woesearchaeota archaeon]
MKPQEKIAEMEAFMSKAQYNKHTEHGFGVMKAQIARLREKLEKESRKKGGGHGFAVKKTGDATVILIGFPSVGKSTLLNKLTNAKSEVAAYAFTTLTVIPGLLEYNKAKIQILDVPGIISGAAAGRGRGTEVLAMVRNCDLVLFVIDALNPEQFDALKKELFDVNVRVNQNPPDVKIAKKERGGLSITSTVRLTKITKETIAGILRELRINNADVVLRSDVDIDQFIDAIEGNRKYVPGVVVVSKIDLVNQEQQSHIEKTIRPDLLVSAQTGLNMEELKEEIFTRLKFMRIYLKEVNKKADLDEPMIVREGTVVRDICNRIHRDFVKKFRFCRVWGKSAKFPGQQFVLLDKQLQDGDILEIHVQ